MGSLLEVASGGKGEERKGWKGFGVSRAVAVLRLIRIPFHDGTNQAVGGPGGAGVGLLLTESCCREGSAARTTDAGEAEPERLPAKGPA